MKIATTQYAIEVLANWEAYTQKIQALALSAQKNYCHLLLLPEYAGVELGFREYDTDAKLYEAIQPLIPKYKDFYQQLAQTHQLYIQPGTIIEATSPGQYRNRAYFFGPQGTMGYQDKLSLVQFEKADPLIKPGTTQTLFNTPFGKISIAICYDSEFPECVRPLTQAGAWLILVPSYNNSLASFNRVYFSCRARAIENQCYVATACAVGPVTISGEPETATGSAAVMGPVDTGFPDDGLIVKGNTNTVELIFAEISPDNIDTVRKMGQTHNFEDAKLLKKLALSDCIL